jgi:hypothetical protein
MNNKKIIIYESKLKNFEILYEKKWSCYIKKCSRFGILILKKRSRFTSPGVVSNSVVLRPNSYSSKGYLTNSRSFMFYKY